MINKSRHKTSSSLALVLLVCFGSWSGAQAGDVRNDAPAPLPLVLDDYRAFVHKLAAEVNGNEAAMATKLRNLGFSCIPVTKSAAFACVRFGCQKRIIGRGSLLQWTVNRSNVILGEPGFDGVAVNYLWAARCIPMNDIEEAQQRFLSGHSPIE
ncbi:hypothetical protein Rleg5DRAFT_5647 [Rhizobium leguminosarum bv. viciae WSM1455]|uniref:hypothetical protein n=1 Tax=Rhizobium acaciae TaxID=2989736 RepID=UPI00027D7706|nr:hypothetical protein [Rhizobium acaciae]EJC69849.1 hypothetical protein Rleg5DRAFT_5647 [Rhizobium leguminosarum bv. viciae WSM1455]MCW1750860.1 hypothetical protein [Rhizobium acaciae]